MLLEAYLKERGFMQGDSEIHCRKAHYWRLASPGLTDMSRLRRGSQHEVKSQDPIGPIIT